MIDTIYKSIQALDAWLEKNDYKAYDPFDGLSSWLLRPLTVNNQYLRIALQQGIRRFPLNLRPLVGIPKARSTKGMGFLARGYIRLHQSTGQLKYATKAKYCLNWLVENQCRAFSGSCWGNHFDYQSRVFYLPKGVPTIVWTALIGHAFLDAYSHFNNPLYLQIAQSACEHICKDLDRHQSGKEVCISYIPIDNKQVHNANTLGASLLARAHTFSGKKEYRELADRAMGYSIKCQREDYSWYYGEKNNLHWVDNFHTAYVLDSIMYYIQATGDETFRKNMINGYQYWKATFFLSDGTPRYYNNKNFPLDIQCASQAIDTFTLFSSLDSEALNWAVKVAEWTIHNMQDPSGFFYYRRYNLGIVNKTPTLHWGQATMLCALSHLIQKLNS